MGKRGAFKLKLEQGFWGTLYKTKSKKDPGKSREVTLGFRVSASGFSVPRFVERVLVCQGLCEGLERGSLGS